MKEKKKLMCFGISITLILTLLVGIFSTFAETGSAESNAALYEISDGKAIIDGVEYIAISDADGLKNMTLGKNYILANDIDCAGLVATNGYLFNFPGENNNDSDSYTTLNGNGYSLTGIDFTSNATNVGVFHGADKKGGKAEGGMTIRDLNIGTTDQYAKITATATGEAFVGTLCGYVNASTTFERVTVYADVTVVNAKVGGFLGGIRWGDNAGHAVVMTDCVFNGTLTSLSCDGAGASGGIIGALNNCSISVKLSDCTNNGSFTGSTTYGGMIGSSSCLLNVTLDGCINNADLETVSHNWGSKLGGMIGQISGGYNVPEYLLSDCVNNGELTAPHKNAGGMIGEFTASPKSLTVQGCRNHGALIGSNDGDGSYGGIIGLYYLLNTSCKLTISKTVNDGSISGPVNVGGLIGMLRSPADVEISQCANLGDVLATNGYAGGFGNSHASSGLILRGEMTVDGFLNGGSVSSVGNSAGGVFGFFTSEGFTTLTNIANLGGISAGEEKTAANFVAESDGFVITPATTAGYGGTTGLTDSSDMTVQEALTFLNSGSIGNKVGEFAIDEESGTLYSTLSALEKTDNGNDDPNGTNGTQNGNGTSNGGSQSGNNPTGEDNTNEDTQASTNDVTTTEKPDADGDQTTADAGNKKSAFGCASSTAMSTVMLIALAGVALLSKTFIKKEEFEL